MSPEESDRERRQYYRVRTRLPLRFRALNPDEFETLKYEIEAIPQEPSDIDPALALRLSGIEQRLERILALLEGRPVADSSPATLCNVEISGSGIRFPCKGEPIVGEDLLVEVQLPGSVPRRIRTIARVAGDRRESNHDPDRDLAVWFRVIDESDRDAIVRFVNSVQRQQIRETHERERES